ncbi:tuftelin-interacting protein 11-like [Vigna unguiculata]|uniref:Tuftelin-interacting protein 11 n=1 Tax=Vigna unguiculata TaxID=3917 RepID=A0A4D6KWX7_VIGUN|nr:tuftelin-interacting protein 11-like [Vigna unguiculata]QCD80547.1 tuftelin-interacting protein 11 [Vigna unguiculata]
MIHSETVPVTVVEAEETHRKGVTSSANIGSFEEHSTGFGSKMMAKMGYMEGGGLEKNGQGMAQPVEVIQRPRSLGLGVKFSNNPGESVGNISLGVGAESLGLGVGLSNSLCEPARNKPSRVGAFEKHTKGFGSKMMPKMGFVEGKGLGRESQGITTPLTALRLPKSQGLGAKS